MGDKKKKTKEKKEANKDKKIIVKALKFVNFWGVGQHMKIEKV